MKMKRVYLDHNATTPVRSEARDAMIAAMDVVGNPSSVHKEGRSAKGLVEKARAQVADIVGCLPSQVIFTGSATEAAALAVVQKERYGGVFAALPTEHDCFGAWSDVELPALLGPEGDLQTTKYDQFANWVRKLAGEAWVESRKDVALVAISAANSETGVMLTQQSVIGNHHVNASNGGTIPFAVVADISQMAGKAPVIYGDRKPSFAVLSAHKLGGPKGVGALINFTAEDPLPMFLGGGQEMGRRSGTENVIGIAGFGAAAAAAKRDVDARKWDRVEKLRNILENALAAQSNETIFVGNGVARLPNTSCVLTPGWKGETQVMQMDLAGFAISAGSACSSGKVKASRVLQAMGYSDSDAASAIRVSLGLETTEQEILRFAEVWGEKYRKHQSRAA